MRGTRSSASVSETVRDLLLGTEISFEDSGERQLEGLGRPRRPYAACPDTEPTEGRVSRS
jgi:hypothetical protein